MFRTIKQNNYLWKSSFTHTQFQRGVNVVLKPFRNNTTTTSNEVSQANIQRKTVRVLITGAAGQIGYSLLPRLFERHLFGKNNNLRVVLNDIPECENILRGMSMELQDCDFPFYRGCKVDCDPETAYKDVDYVIMLANMMQLTPETTRFELLKENKRIYIELAKIIDATARPTTKFVMVANPANTNCLLLAENVKNIPVENFTCLTYLDYNRTRSEVARAFKVNLSRIRKVIVWGNHSSTMFPDLTHAEIMLGFDRWVKLTDARYDKKFLNEDLPKFIQTRFTQIIEARKKSSSFSAAHAVVRHVRALYRSNNSNINDWHCMGVKSIGQYGLPDNIYFGTPCYAGDGEYKIVEDLEIDPFIREKMQISAEELLNERNSVME